MFTKRDNFLRSIVYRRIRIRNKKCRIQNTGLNPMGRVRTAGKRGLQFGHLEKLADTEFSKLSQDYNNACRHLMRVEERKERTRSLA